MARIEDAAVLTNAEQDSAQIPGFLVSRPHELTTESFAAKTTELATLGRYIVAENNQRIIGHALLDPMRLEATAHVFRLTIVVHPGFQNPGVGRGTDERSDELGEAGAPSTENSITCKSDTRTSDPSLVEDGIYRRGALQKTSEIGKRRLCR